MLRVMKIDHVTLRILIESCINISGILEKTNGNANRRVRVGLKVRQVEASYFEKLTQWNPRNLTNLTSDVWFICYMEKLKSFIKLVVHKIKLSGSSYRRLTQMNSLNGLVFSKFFALWQ